MRTNLKALFRMALCGAAVFAIAGAAPQAGKFKIGLAENDRHFRTEAVVTRTAQIRFEEPVTSISLRLVWTTLAGEAVLEKGNLGVMVAAGRDVIVPFQLKMPAVRRIVNVQMAMTANGGPAGTASLAETFRVYPKNLELPWIFLRERHIGVLDRSGKLTERIRTLGGQPQMLSSIEQSVFFEGDLLVLGEESVDHPRDWNAVREILRHCRCPVVALHQSWGEAAEGPWRGVWNCAPGHPLFLDWTAGDWAGWRGKGVSRGPWLDEPAGKGRCLWHVNDGWSDYGKLVLTEERMARGRLLLRCQAPLMERWDVEPACELLLNNLLRRAIESGEKKGR